MFKSLIVLSLFVIQVTGAYAADAFYAVQCYNDQTQFKIVNIGNPRNKATDQIADQKGLPVFKGVWLWLTSKEEGYYHTKSQFKTMGGGVLTVSKQMSLGRGGCGRAGCENIVSMRKISAHYVDLNAKEYFYDCHQLSK